MKSRTVQPGFLPPSDGGGSPSSAAPGRPAAFLKSATAPWRLAARSCAWQRPLEKSQESSPGAGAAYAREGGGFLDGRRAPRHAHLLPCRLAAGVTATVVRKCSCRLAAVRRCGGAAVRRRPRPLGARVLQEAVLNIRGVCSTRRRCRGAVFHGLWRVASLLPSASPRRVNCSGASGITGVRKLDFSIRRTEPEVRVPRGAAGRSFPRLLAFFPAVVRTQSDRRFVLFTWRRGQAKVLARTLGPWPWRRTGCTHSLLTRSVWRSLSKRCSHPFCLYRSVS
jgi:hypothetical protein